MLLKKKHFFALIISVQTLALSGMQDNLIKEKATLLLEKASKNQLTACSFSSHLNPLDDQARLLVINTQDLKGNTLAHYAYIFDNQELVRRIAGSKADTEITNNEGKRAGEYNKWRAVPHASPLANIGTTVLQPSPQQIFSSPQEIKQSPVYNFQNTPIPQAQSPFPLDQSIEAPPPFMNFSPYQNTTSTNPSWKNDLANLIYKNKVEKLSAKLFDKTHCDNPNNEASELYAYILKCSAHYKQTYVFVSIVEKFSHVFLKDTSCGAELFHAILYGYLPAVIYFRNKNPNLLSSRTASGYTPLHWAVRKDNPQIIEYFSKLSNIQTLAATKDNNGATPLHWAAYCMNQKVLDMIKNWTDNIDLQDKHGATPLHWTCKKGTIESLDMFLSKKANPTISTTTGKTALHLVVRQIKNLQSFITKLLEAGAHINAQIHNGPTPLHEAILIGNSHAIELLIRNGANTDLVATIEPTSLNSETNSEFKRLLPLELLEMTRHSPMVKDSIRTLLQKPVETLNLPQQQDPRPLSSVTSPLFYEESSHFAQEHYFVAQPDDQFSTSLYDDALAISPTCQETSEQSFVQEKPQQNSPEASSEKLLGHDEIESIQRPNKRPRIFDTSVHQEQEET